MIIKELIEQLKELDPNLLVVVSSNGEWDDFGRPNNIYSNRKYIDRHTVLLAELTPELIEQGYTEEDITDEGEGERCIVLW